MLEFIQNMFQQLLQLPNILYVILFLFTMRITYSSSHFTGSSTIIPKILKIVSFIYSLVIFAYPIIVGIKLSVPFAIFLFIFSLIFAFILNSIRNNIIYSYQKNKLTEKINNDETLNLSHKQAIFQAHCNHSMDVFIVYFSYIGLIFGIPIIIYLVHYVLTALF